MAGEFKIKNGVIVNDTQPINMVSTDGTLSGDSDTTLPTEKAIKAYINSTIADIGVLSARYKFTTSTSGDPTSGHAGLNNASPSITDHINISYTDSAGHDRSYGINSLQDRDYIALEDRNTTDHYTYMVIGNPVNNTTYATIPVQFISEAGTLNNNENITAEVVFKGAKEFVDLLDTPATYATRAGKAAVVNSTEDGIEFAERRIGKSKYVPSVTLAVGEYLHVATLSSISSASISGVVDSEFYAPAFNLNTFHVYDDIKYEFGLTHYTQATDSQFDKLIFTQTGNGAPINVYLRISNVHTNPSANIALDASYTKSELSDPGITLLGALVTSVSDIKLEIDITAKDFRSTNVAPSSGGSSLWEVDGNDALKPITDHTQVSIGTSTTGVGKLEVHVDNTPSGSMEVTNAEPGYDGIYTMVAADHYAMDVDHNLVDTGWYWVMCSDASDAWNTGIAQGAGGNATPASVTTYTALGGTSATPLVSDTATNILEAITTNGKIFSEDTIKSLTNFNVKDQIVMGVDTSGENVIGLNDAAGNGIALDIVEDAGGGAVNAIMRLNIDGTAKLPACTLSEITENDDIATKEYVDNHPSGDTLQYVTNNGNETTNNVIVTDSAAHSAISDIGQGDLNIKTYTGATETYITPNNIRFKITGSAGANTTIKSDLYGSAKAKIIIENPSSDITNSEIDVIGDTALITKGYADDNYTGGGGAVGPNNNINTSNGSGGFKESTLSINDTANPGQVQLILDSNKTELSITAKRVSMGNTTDPTTNGTKLLPVPVADSDIANKEYVDQVLKTHMLSTKYYINGSLPANTILSRNTGATHDLGFFVPDNGVYEVVGIVSICGSYSASQASDATIRISDFSSPSSTQYSYGAGNTLYQGSIFETTASVGTQFYGSSFVDLSASPVTLPTDRMVMVEFDKDFFNVTDLSVDLVIRVSGSSI